MQKIQLTSIFEKENYIEPLDLYIINGFTLNELIMLILKI